MRSFGVVAEFNPFHDGHCYFINEVKKMTGSDVCVAAMSGDFTQRGEPALFDKWSRALAAVNLGADLVVEIPVVFAASSASYFARGGVKVLDGLGCLDYLAFGSETGDLKTLERYAECIRDNTGGIQEKISELIKEGKSYPAARAEAVSGILGVEEVPGPNDILAIEYLLQKPFGMTPVTVKRKGEGHNETASSIREDYRKKSRKKFDSMLRAEFTILASKILSMDEDELSLYPGASSGLGNKLKNEIRNCKDLEELTEAVKSKVYTRTRISRLLTDIMLGIKENDITVPAYIRVLAMNEKGSGFLKEVKQRGTNTLPIISNINKEGDLLNEEAKNMISFDILAADVYNIINTKDMYLNCDMVKMPAKA